MRPKTLNFEQLFQLNKQELMQDKKQLSQIEIRLEKRQSINGALGKEPEQNKPFQAINSDSFKK
ncbi:FbpB family small basic protein [Oceanobacillus kapialis]|uniref:FbpB family small basic protein n=1 Tax=Oceanobacillus kapialis TaxID=481353 RepID=UPI00384E722E